MSKHVPRIFLDTCILKSSADSQLVLRRTEQSLVWGGRHFNTVVHRPALFNPNTKFIEQGKTAKFADTVALRFLARLAKDGKICLAIHHEIRAELWRLRFRGRRTEPLFFGAPIENVQGPVKYSRILVDGSGRDWQYECLARIEHPRFKELQKWSGAFQGNDKPLNRSQLLDAFHLWCAETANADYFLTQDESLIRTVTGRKPERIAVQLVTPFDLLSALLRRNRSWSWSIFREAWKLRQSGRRLNMKYQDSDQFWAG